MRAGLLENGRIDIEDISGTSAGSMVAAVLAHGLIDGSDAARQALHDDGVCLGLPSTMISLPLICTRSFCKQLDQITHKLLCCAIPTLQYTHRL